MIEAGHVPVIESLGTVPDLTAVRGDRIDADDLRVIAVARVPEIIREDGPVPETEGGAIGLVPDPGTAIVNYHVGEVELVMVTGFTLYNLCFKLMSNSTLNPVYCL